MKAVFGFKSLAVGTGTRSARYSMLVMALLALGFSLLLSISIGSRAIGIGDIINAFASGGRSTDYSLIATLRMPRTLLAVLVGAALGVSGALIQALTRSPLADPGILGVNAGAAFFVVAGVGLLGLSGIHTQMYLAFAGAALASAVVYAMGASGQMGMTPGRLLLSGVAVAAMLGGLTTGVLLLDPVVFDRMRQWSAGSLVVSGFDIPLAVAPAILIGLILAALAAPALNAMALGDEMAAGLGANRMLTRAMAVVAITLLSGAATAAAGPIMFVGLMVPHLARRIAGPDQRWIIAFTMVLAPALMLVSDVMGRLLLRPAELQVGIITAFIGAPVLIMVARGRIAGP